MGRYRAALFVGLATAFSLLGDQTLYSVLPTYYAELGLLPYQVGLVLSINRGIRLLTNHMAERLCRRYSLSLLFGLSLTGGACLTAVYALVPAFVVLLLARMGWGLCWSFIRQIGLMTVVDSAEAGSTGRLMGFYSGICSMGSIAGNLGGALGHDLFGYTTILVAFAVISGLAAPLGPLSRRNLRHVEQTHAEPVERGVGVWLQVDWRLLLAGFLASCVGSGLVTSTLGLVLKESIGESLSVRGVTIGVATLTGAVMASRWVANLAGPLMGGVSDRIGRRSGATLFSSCGALALVVAAYRADPGALVLAIPLYFIFAMGMSITLTTEAGVRGPRALASYVTASDLGSFAGPLLGWLVPQFGLPTGTIFVAAAGLYCLAGLAAFTCLQREKGSP